jgi:formiminotetrahydrofolate cyclodeaminase
MGGSLGELTLAEFDRRLASSDPVPGGGSASAIAASLAASLLAMVSRLSLDRPKYEPFRATIDRALPIADQLRDRFIVLADEDAVAYAGYMEARKLPKETPDEQRERDAALSAAARRSTDAPLETVRLCAQLMESIESLAGRSNLNAASDLEVAAQLCNAAARGAAANVLINLPSVGDNRFAGGATAEVEYLLHGIERQLLNVSQLVARGTLRSPE